MYLLRVLQLCSCVAVKTMIISSLVIVLLCVFLTVTAIFCLQYLFPFQWYNVQYNVFLHVFLHVLSISVFQSDLYFFLYSIGLPHSLIFLPSHFSTVSIFTGLPISLFISLFYVLFSIILQYSMNMCVVCYYCIITLHSSFLLRI